MQNYIAQKAQQALEALCEDRPLLKRLELAKLHFENCEQYLDTAPSEVQEDIRRFLGCDIERDVGQASLALQSAIEGVFEECGREAKREGR